MDYLFTYTQYSSRINKSCKDIVYLICYYCVSFGSQIEEKKLWVFLRVIF